MKCSVLTRMLYCRDKPQTFSQKAAEVAHYSTEAIQVEITDWSFKRNAMSPSGAVATSLRASALTPMSKTAVTFFSVTIKGIHLGQTVFTLFLVSRTRGFGIRINIPARL